MSDPDALTLREAAERVGVARTTIRRALDKGRFPNAYRDDAPPHAWRVPLGDLTTAGYQPVETTPASTPPAPASASVPALLSDLAPLLERVSNAERERADAEAAARIAAHRAEQAEQARTDLADQLDRTTATTRRRDVAAGLAGAASVLVVLALVLGLLPASLANIDVAALAVLAALAVAASVAAVWTWPRTPPSR